jgi:hypothetical protein
MPTRPEQQRQTGSTQRAARRCGRLVSGQRMTSDRRRQLSSSAEGSIAVDSLCGGGARTAAGLTLLLSTLTAGHLALIPAANSIVLLAVALLLAGAVIAPTEATLYSMVDNVAPAGTITEAFALLANAMGLAAPLEPSAQESSPTAPARWRCSLASCVRARSAFHLRRQTSRSQTW